MPEFTASDEPAMSSASARCTSAARLLEPLARHELAEEHDLGLQRAAADGAVGHDESDDVADVHVAVGVQRRRSRRPTSHGLSASMRSAIAARANSWPQRRQTTRSTEPCTSTTWREPALQVQAVDVLGDDAVDAAGRLQVGERAVPGVRAGGHEARQPRWLPAQ